LNNPFHQENERFEHIVFSKITQSIDKWMLEKYPLFDSSLEAKIKKCEILNDNLSKTIQEFRKYILDENLKTKTQTLEEINKYLKVEYPKLNKDLLLISKKLEKKEETLGKQVKKIVTSQNLYKDVYAMRDEMIILKNNVNEFTEKLKKVFK